MKYDKIIEMIEASEKEDWIRIPNDEDRLYPEIFTFKDDVRISINIEQMETYQDGHHHIIESLLNDKIENRYNFNLHFNNNIIRKFFTYTLYKDVGVHFPDFKSDTIENENRLWIDHDLYVLCNIASKILAFNKSLIGLMHRSGIVDDPEYG